MTEPLVQSNRNRRKIQNQLKPQHSAKVSDFTKPNKKDKKTSKNVSSVTFDTNMRMNNHTRNKLQAMAILGYAVSQKDAIDVALGTYIEQLPKRQREALKLQIDTLEQRDIRTKQNK